eukprot:TRINITY_DN9390_c0_g1_i2.p1 TRINITY_DN9390_c0_g1~~TRINITY_DN9390_c0_g1_i2.p1  ORF type:complete len:512 (+),score=109.82 TRINITY_DN9390_c0_g1_i2:231-1766(+)
MVIKHLCEELESLDEPEARGAMIWIIGEYSPRIENSHEILQTFLSNFSEEHPQVQLQLLTAIVKLYLARGDIAQEMVQTVLTLSTSESNNPDLRDRGYIYWRLLSTDPEAARAVVASEKPVIRDDTNQMDNGLLDDLIPQLATLASVYHKAPESFTTKTRSGLSHHRGETPQTTEEDFTEGDGDNGELAAGPGGINLLDLDDFTLPVSPPMQRPAAPSPQVTSPPVQVHNQHGYPASTMAPVPVASQIVSQPAAAASYGDLLGGLAGITTAAQPAFQVKQKPKAMLLTAEKGKGMSLLGTFSRKNQQPHLEFTFENHTQGVLTGFAIQFNKNSFSILQATPLNLPSLMPGQRSDVQLPLSTNGQNSGVNPPSPNVQMAIKNSSGIYYFQLQMPLHIMYLENGRAEKTTFLSLWRSTPDHEERSVQLNGLQLGDYDSVQKTLEAHNIFLVAQRKNEFGQAVYYMSASTSFGVNILFEFVFSAPNSSGKLSLRSPRAEWLAFAEASFADVLKP